MRLSMMEGVFGWADNTLRDLHNSSYHTKAEFNNCFIIRSKYFQSSEIDFGVEFLQKNVANPSSVAGFRMFFSWTYALKLKRLPFVTFCAFLQS